MYELVLRVLNNVQDMFELEMFILSFPKESRDFIKFEMLNDLCTLIKFICIWQLMSYFVDYDNKFNKSNIGVRNMDMESGSERGKCDE